MFKTFKARMIAAVGVAVVGAGLIACAGVSDKESQTGDSTQVNTGSGQVPAPKPSYHTPVAADFALEIKVLEQSCFGSAGCNVTYRIDMTYKGAGPLDPDVTYEVTYELKGSEDPKIDTFTVTGDEYRRDESDMVQTPSSKTKLTAVVTSVTTR